MKKALRFVILTFSILLMQSCMDEYSHLKHSNSIVDIAPGMDHQQVIRILGFPDNRSTYSNNEERWYYNQSSQIIVFSNGRVIALEYDKEQAKLNQDLERAKASATNINLNNIFGGNSKKHHKALDNIFGESKKRPKEFDCVNHNIFGYYPEGGGCNTFGCWPKGGSCNTFGCSYKGVCTVHGCPHHIKDNLKCIED